MNAITITTHVLDTSIGRPAAGVAVTLSSVDGAGGAGGGTTVIGRGTTDADGRCSDLAAEGSQLSAGTYRMHFATGAYFEQQHVEAFYPAVTIDFDVRDSTAHYHVPLLLSPFGFSTYRGS